MSICKLPTGRLAFREVIGTGNFGDATSNDILPGGTISPEEEVHGDADQFIYVLQGKGIVTMDNTRDRVHEGDFITIPSGTFHQIENTGKSVLKLIVVYTRIIHRPGCIQMTAEDPEC